METCPRCGTQAAVAQPYCPLCGMALVRPAESPAPAAPAQHQAQLASSKKTVFGIAPGEPGTAPHGQPGFAPGAPAPRQGAQGAGAVTVDPLRSAHTSAPAAYGQTPFPDSGPRPGLPSQENPASGMPQAAGGPQQASPSPAALVPAAHQAVGQPFPDFVGKNRATVLGMPEQPSPQAASVQQPLDKHRTMLGMAPATPVGGSPVPQPDPSRTMKGVPPHLSPIAPPPGQVGAPPQAALPQGPVALQQPNSNARTMLGVAMPGIAPTHQHLQPSQPQQPQPVQPPQHKTILGVAMPGIAPSRAFGEQPQLAPPHAPPTLASAQPPEQPLQARRRVRVSVADAPPLYRRPAFILAVFGGAVVVIVVLFALLWPTKPPIESEARVNEQGKDVLRLTCATCPDGTTMTIEGAQARATGGVTEIPLQRSLIVGRNVFAVHIDRPNSGRDEAVELVIPVAFRVRPDLAGLAGDTPAFHVEVEATPGTTVLVDNKPLALGENGKGRYEVDVTDACTGPKAETEIIDRKIGYTIQPKGAAPSTGFVSVKVVVTPLTLQSPRPSTVVDVPHFLVAGRTARGAIIEIEGSKFAAGSDGTFSRKMQIKRVGETSVRVRSTLPEHAPRTVVFRVKRVDDLAAEAEAFADEAKLEVAALMSSTNTHKGEKVVLTGEVVEARTQGFERIVLLDVVGACSKPPCLARLVYAGAEALARGEKIRVFGHVAGAVQSGDRPAPEIDVDFLLKGRGR